jgi:tetratricopeptide (TPR) repeat protein
MEPLLLLNGFLGAAIGGIIGNRSDEIFCRVMQEVVNRLRQGEPPVNHDLQRAVREAYLQATLVVCYALYEERGVPPQVWRRDLRTVLCPPDEIRWLDKVCRWINEELRQLPKATYQPPSTDADHQIELLLQPKGTTAEQRAKELADKLKQSLLEEVRRFGEPPERFVQMIQQGWTLTQPDKTEVRLDWFDLLCAFFVNTLKTTPKVRAIFEGKLLANLAVESVPITLDQIDQLFSRKVSEEIVQQIQESERRLAQLMAEGFEASRKREEAILDFLRQTFGSQHLVIALQDRTRAFIDRIGTQAFVPREGALQQLENWLTRESGVAILHAPAGYGKTTFLAHLVKASREAGDTRVVYHFFSKDPDLGGYATSPGNALAHLLGQVAAITDSSQSREGLYASAVDPDSRRAQLENTIQELKLAEGERLLIVLDGLDEADETLHPPLRKPLPAGVFVVVSGRWDGAGNPPDYLQHWLEIADEIIPIDAMSASEIAQWLQQAGDGELRAYADDDAFVQQILEKTDGLPLFLDFLLDDLLQAAKQSQNVRQVLHQTPTGFSNYVRQQFRQLAASVGQQPAVRTLFGILSVSKGALRENEIAKLTGLSGWDLAALPSQATRWWRIGGEDGKRTYSFAHPLLAVEFAKVLGSEAERARQSLLAWCAEWQTHKSPYALRHYAEHLREAKQVDALYALARDEAFAHAQREGIPHDPDLPRQTAALALQAAIETEDAPMMAEMLLLHARRVETVESPLDALRAGNPQRALKLAERILREQNYQIGTLWLLLLAWASSMGENGAAFAVQCLNCIRDWWHANRPKPLSDNWAPVVVKVLLQLQCAQAAEMAIILQDKAKADLVRGLLESGLCPLDERVEQALAAAERIEDADWRSRAYRAVALALAQAGQPEQAQEAFQQALAAAERIENAYWRSSAYRAVALALAQAGQPEQALAAAERIENADRRSEAYHAVALALAQAGQPKQALAAAERIENAYRRSEAYGAVALALAQAGQPEQAQEAFQQALAAAERIEDAYWRSEAYRAVALALAQAGQPEQAQEAFQQALAAAERIEWADGRSEAYHAVALALALAQAGQPKQAQEAFQQALAAAERIEWANGRSEAYREVALALAQAGQPEQAQEAFQQALAAAERIEDAYWRSGAYREVAEALAQAGLADQALAAAERIEKADWRSWAYRAVAVALAQAGQIEQAQEAFQQALAAAERIEKADWRSEAYRAVALALAQAGQPKQAQEAFQQALAAAERIEWANGRSEAYRAVALALAQAGQAEQALAAAERIEKADWRSEAYRAVALALAQAGLAEQALAAAERIEDADWRSSAYRAVAEAVAEALAQAGQVEQALAAAERIEDADWRSSAYRKVALALAQAGQIEQALAAAERIEWANGRSSAYRKVALALAQAGQPEQAQEAFQQALAAAERIEWANGRSEAYREVALALAQAGQPEQAQEAFQQALAAAERIEDAYWRSEAYRAVALALAQAGQIEQAQEAFQQALAAAERIEDAYGRSGAYRKGAEALAQAGQIEQAQEAFQQALAAAERIEDAYWRSWAYREVAEALAQAGQAEQALAAAERIIEDADWRSEAYRAVALALAQAGQVEQALAAAERIEDAYRRSEAYRAVVKALAQAGQFEQALAAAERIEDAYERSRAYGAVALALAQAGQTEQAQKALAQALEVARQISSPGSRYDALWQVARASAEIGAGELAQQLVVYELPVGRGEELPAIMSVLAQRGDTATFLALLPLCGWSRVMAFKVCLSIATLYPEHNLAVLKLLARELGIGGDIRSDDESA